jgi:hypothetical protein
MFLRSGANDLLQIYVPGPSPHLAIPPNLYPPSHPPGHHPDWTAPYHAMKCVRSRRKRVRFLVTHLHRQWAAQGLLPTGHGFSGDGTLRPRKTYRSLDGGGRCCPGDVQRARTRGGVCRYLLHDSMAVLKRQQLRDLEVMGIPVDMPGQLAGEDRLSREQVWQVVSEQEGSQEAAEVASCEAEPQPRDSCCKEQGR